MRLPKPTLLLRPEGSRDRNGPVSPTVLGGVRVVKGRYGRAWEMAEASTNYHTNPVLGYASTAGWATWASTGSTIAARRIAGPPEMTEYIYEGEITAIGHPSHTLYFYMSIATGALTGQVSAMCLVKSSRPIAGVPLHIRLNYTDTPFVETARITVDLTGEPQWVIFPVATIDPARTLSSVQCFLNLAGKGQVGDKIWMTCGQIENRNYVTPFFHGGMGAGFAWSGTAWASRSTRANAYVTLPLGGRLSPHEGTMLVRYRDFGTGSTRYVLEVGTHAVSGTDWTSMPVVSGFQTYWRKGLEEAITNHPSGRPATMEWVGGVQRWDGTRVDVRTDTTSWRSSTRVEPHGEFRDTIQFRRGSLGLNGWIEAIVFFDEVLTDEQVDYLLRMNHAWTWNELAGETGRITSVVQRGGAYTSRARLWVADRSGRRIEELPVNIPVEGTIDFNEDRAVKRTLSLVVNDPGRLRPFKDYLIPEIVQTDAAGNVQVEPMGHFIVTPPRRTLTLTRYAGSLEAQDISWVLANDGLSDEVVIPPGTDRGAAARELTLTVLDARQVNIPDTGSVTTEETVIHAGTMRLAAIGDLLEASSWYVPAVDGYGILQTSPYHDLSTAQPSRRYSTAERSVSIVPPLDDDPDWSRLRNRVVVRNIQPDKDPIVAVAEVTNPSSPVHPANLGTPEHPLWLTETIEDSQVQTYEEALAVARNRLASGASYYQKLNIRTVADLRAGAHDVIELDVREHGASYTGLFLRRAWQLSIKGIVTLTTAEVTRVEQWR